VAEEGDGKVVNPLCREVGVGGAKLEPRWTSADHELELGTAWPLPPESSRSPLLIPPLPMFTSVVASRDSPEP